MYLKSLFIHIFYIFEKNNKSSYHYYFHYNINIFRIIELAGGRELFSQNRTKAARRSRHAANAEERERRRRSPSSRNATAQQQQQQQPHRTQRRSNEDYLRVLTWINNYSLIFTDLLLYIILSLLSLSRFNRQDTIIAL